MRLGYVSGVFGLRGEVRLFLYNPSSDLLYEGLDVDLVALDGARRRVSVHARPGAGKKVLGRIEGVTDAETAASLAGFELVVDRGVLPELEDGTYYHHQLIGLAVETADGRQIGRIEEIHTAGVDTWIVRDGSAESWVMVRSGVVLDVDLDAGTATIADDAVVNLEGEGKGAL